MTKLIGQCARPSVALSIYDDLGPDRGPAAPSMPRAKEARAPAPALAAMLGRVSLNLAVAFGVLIAVLLGMGWLGLNRMAKMNGKIQEIVDQRWQKVQLSRKALEYSALNSRITMQVFLTEDRRQIGPLLELRASNTEQISGLLKQIEGLPESEAERNLIANVRTSRSPYVEGYKKALGLLLDKNQPEAARAMMANEVLPSLIAYHRAWEAFVELQGEQMNQAGKAAKEYSNSARSQVLGLLLLAAGLASGIAVFVTRNMTKEAADRRRAEQALREARASAPIGIFEADAAGRAVFTNPHWQKITGLSLRESLGAGWQRAIHPDDAKRIVEEWSHAVREGLAHEAEFRFCRPDGETRWVHLRVAPVLSETGERVGQIGTTEDITARKRAEAELAKAHKELVVASRQAGMAEVATGVLHNVGNVLNSVNVSATVMRESLKASEVASLGRVAALMRDHDGDLAGFLTADPKGRLIPGFVIQLADSLASEHAMFSAEHEQLARNIEHIKEIVAMQQNYARVSGVLEKVQIADVLEDALRINSGGLERHGVEVVRNFGEVPVATVDKHKVMQIFVNLVHNAKYALDESELADRRITLGIGMSGTDRIRIVVADNGVGIAQENLTRIFSRGFTTRRNGHGFGLHSGSIAAREMGGFLKAESGGIGRGATFTLEIPVSGERSDHG